MSQFELITITLSLILGLGITGIMSSCLTLIRARNEISLNWPPFVWAFCIFAFHIQFLFGVMAGGTPEGYIFLLVLLITIFLFFSGGLVLPKAANNLPATLQEEFDAQGRLALIPLSGYLVLTIIYDTILFDNIQNSNIVMSFLLLIAICAFITKNHILQKILAISFVSLELYGLLFIWSRP